MMEKIIEIYAIMAFTIFAFGMISKLSYYSYIILKRGWGLSKPSGSSLASWYQTIKLSICYPYQKWWQINPIMFTGHVLYHAGLFTAIGIYVTVLMIGSEQLAKMNFVQALLFVCDWFAVDQEVFPGILNLVVKNIFLLALISAVTGMSIPFVMSFLKKRGYVRPVDQIAESLDIKKIPGLKSRQRGRWRRIVGIMVLTMDVAMLVSFLRPTLSHYSCIIHVMFAMNIIMLLPFSFLSHEWNRIGLLRAIYHHRHRFVP